MPFFHLFFNIACYKIPSTLFYHSPLICYFVIILLFLQAYDAYRPAWLFSE